MKKTLSQLIAGLCVCAFSTASLAEDLLQVYQQAKMTNPALRASAADRNIAFEKIDQARSPLLPQLGVTANYGYSSGFRDANGNDSDSVRGNVSLNQVLFDMSKWEVFSQQEKSAAIQDVNYQIAQQDLVLTTATAYFNVLRAIDALSYSEAKKKAFYRQLDQTSQRFKVGLVAITDVQNAKAQYDAAVAEEVSAQNQVDNTVENLRNITGHYYPTLASLNIDKFKAEREQPVSFLLTEAEKHNLSLLSARLSQDLAREQIRLAQAGHLPTLNLSLSTDLSRTTNHASNTGPQANNNGTIGANQVGLNFVLPIYSGGGVSSAVRQGEENYLKASENLEAAHRSTVQNVRSSFNNINASVSSISALEQAVVSAEASLAASEAGYKVGTRTIVEVLNATSALYNSKQQLSNARYDYLINSLTLKSALGTLKEQDLASMNERVDEPISTSSVREE